jgi:hypothetical protein
MKRTAVIFCREHGNALVQAALIHECSTDEEVREFVADCLDDGGLYEPAHALWGNDLAVQCPACCYLHPHDAINDAVASALVARRCARRSPALN